MDILGLCVVSIFNLCFIFLSLYSSNKFTTNNGSPSYAMMALAIFGILSFVTIVVEFNTLYFIIKRDIRNLKYTYDNQLKNPFNKLVNIGKEHTIYLSIYNLVSICVMLLISIGVLIRTENKTEEHIFFLGMCTIVFAVAATVASYKYKAYNEYNELLNKVKADPVIINALQK